MPYQPVKTFLEVSGSFAPISSDSGLDPVTFILRYTKWILSSHSFLSHLSILESPGGRDGDQCHRRMPPQHLPMSALRRSAGWVYRGLDGCWGGFIMCLALRFSSSLLACVFLPSEWCHLWWPITHHPNKIQLENVSALDPLHQPPHLTGRYFSPRQVVLFIIVIHSVGQFPGPFCLITLTTHSTNGHGRSGGKSGVHEYRETCQAMTPWKGKTHNRYEHIHPGWAHTRSVLCNGNTGLINGLPPSGGTVPQL